MEKTRAVLLTTQDVCKIASVTPMTVYNWRQERTGRTKLPAVLVVQGRHGKRAHRPGVRFKPGTLVKWALKNSIPLDLPTLKKIELSREVERG